MKKMRTLLSIAFALMVMVGSAQKKYDYGPDSVNCVKNLSLFNEFITQKAYTEAVESWRAATDLCPKSRKGLYVSGEKMFKKLIKAETDETKKQGLIDDLFRLYQMRIDNFGQEGFVTGKWGNDMFKYRKDDPCAAKDMMKKAVDKQGNKTGAVVVSNYYNSLYKCYRKDNATLEELFTEYLSLSDIINHNIETLEDSTKASKYVKAKNNLDEFFVKIAKCEDVVRIFGERIKAAPDDMDLKRKALRIMSRKECDDDPLFIQVAEAVHNSTPSHESAYALARRYAKAQDIDGALKYFEEAVSLCGGCAEMENYLEKAAIVASGAGQHGKAVGFANQLLRLNPNNGYGYIVKGNRMMTSAGRCDDGKLGKYAAYWLAADYYQRALNVDDSDKVKDFARKQLNSAAARYPSKEDVFFVGAKSGDSYSLPCEGGASTTVRVK